MIILLIALMAGAISYWARRRFEPPSPSIGWLDVRSESRTFGQEREARQRRKALPPVHPLSSTKPLIGFIRAIIIGSMPVIVLPAIIFLPDALRSSYLSQFVYRIEFLIFVSMFPLIIVTAGALIIGLPVTFVLIRCNRESYWAYIVAGSAAGALSIAGVFATGSSSSGLDLPLMGGLCGGLTGWAWWTGHRIHHAAGSASGDGERDIGPSLRRGDSV